MSVETGDPIIPSGGGRALREMRTPRLRLCVPRPEDFEESATLWRDEDVTRFIGGRPQAQDEVWSRHLRYIGHWASLGFGYWIVREASTGRFAGEVGFADNRRPLPPPFGDAPEAGWAMAPWTRGLGLAHEAAAAALTFADARFIEDRTVCMIDPDNERSIRLALRLGYRRYAQEAFRGSAVTLFERTRGGRTLDVDH